MPWNTYSCPHCGSTNDIEVDTSAGRNQSYVEDCQTCCRPNVLTITLDSDGEGAIVDAAKEND